MKVGSVEATEMHGCRQRLVFDRRTRVWEGPGPSCSPPLASRSSSLTSGWLKAAGPARQAHCAGCLCYAQVAHALPAPTSHSLAGSDLPGVHPRPPAPAAGVGPREGRLLAGCCGPAPGGGQDDLEAAGGAAGLQAQRGPRPRTRAQLEAQRGPQPPPAQAAPRAQRPDLLSGTLVDSGGAAASLRLAGEQGCL